MCMTFFIADKKKSASLLISLYIQWPQKSPLLNAKQGSSDSPDCTGSIFKSVALLYTQQFKLKCFSIKADNNLPFNKSLEQITAAYAVKISAEQLPDHCRDWWQSKKPRPVETSLTVFNSEQSFEAQHYACNTCLRLRAIIKNYKCMFSNDSVWRNR